MPGEHADWLMCSDSKQSKSLPWITTAPNPYKATRFAPEYEGIADTVQDTMSSASNRKRHGALPSESWQFSFDEHFRNYRNVGFPAITTSHADRLEVHPRTKANDASSLPRGYSTSQQPMVHQRCQTQTHSQGAVHQDSCGRFADGCLQSKISEYPEIMAALQQQRGLAQDEQQVESDLAEIPAANEEEMMNEEEAMNDDDEWAEDDGSEWQEDYGAGEEEEDEEDEDEGNNEEAEMDYDDAVEVDDERYFLEPEQSKHLPREPALPLLAAFSQVSPGVGGPNFVSPCDSGACIGLYPISTAGFRTHLTFSPPKLFPLPLTHQHRARPRPSLSLHSTPAGYSRAFSSLIRNCRPTRLPIFDNLPRHVSSLLYGRLQLDGSRRMELRWTRHRTRCGGALGWYIGRSLGDGHKETFFRMQRTCLRKSSS